MSGITITAYHLYCKGENATPVGSCDLSLVPPDALIQPQEYQDNPDHYVGLLLLPKCRIG